MHLRKTELLPSYGLLPGQMARRFFLRILESSLHHGPALIPSRPRGCHQAGLCVSGCASACCPRAPPAERSRTLRGKPDRSSAGKGRPRPRSAATRPPPTSPCSAVPLPRAAPRREQQAPLCVARAFPKPPLLLCGLFSPCRHAIGLFGYL